MASVKYDLAVKTEIQRRLANAVNYNNWIYACLEPHIGRHVLEVGCSIGNFTEKLAERADTLISIDVVEEYIEMITARFGRQPNFRAYHLDICDPAILSVTRNKRIDTIICLNVLEHIEADLSALKHMHQLLTPGGRLLLLVPAFQILYGTMDKADDHFRRYNKRMARTRLEKVGFRVQKIHYMNLPGFFGWYFNGRILKRKVLPARQLASFDRVVPMVRAIENFLPPPFGQSLFVVSVK
ncbi:MAG: class I SAM-dependent methyltransferase [Acidobacteria bacterium]|nr:class I SAM-dependent methyltransferase [Acidobacteriota bacterium]MBI3656176.1 class I SAM-dependent methyltransferase [Acidobacteriota bacterium]